MRRAAKWLGGILAVLVALPVLLLLVANTGPGRRGIEALTPRLTGDTVRLSGLTGRFPDALRVAHAELRDAKGAYTTVDDLALDWSPSQLLHWHLVLDRLAAARVDVLRMPVSSSSSSSGLPIPVTIRALQVPHLAVAAELVGSALAVSVEGSGAMLAADRFNAALNLHQVEGPGSYQLNASRDAAGYQVALHASEPTRGLIGGLAGLPELGATQLDADLHGPGNAVATRVTLAAGPLHAAAEGTLDLDHAAADLTVKANAPPMQPRPDITWQAIALDAHVRGPFATPDASGKLRIEKLAAAGAVASALAFDITGNAGALRVTGEVDDLRIPTPQPDLLAGDKLLITAEAKLDAPELPVHLTLSHRLFSVAADATLGAAKRVDATVTVADLQPLAATGQVDLQGGLKLALHGAMQGDTTTVDATGTVGVTGGQAQAQALVGEEGKLALAATLRGNDLTLSKLEFTGRAASFSAGGTVADDKVDLTWTLGVNDLAAAQPDLAGAMRANGKVSGTTDNLNLIADIDGGVTTRGVSSGALTAHIEAHGLPNDPGGRITAQGELQGAPVNLAVGLQRRPDGFAIDIEQASWRSLRAEGALVLPTATMIPSGNLRLAMTRLADLAPLLGRPIDGTLDLRLNAAPDAAKPVLDAKLDVEGLRTSGIAGSLHATVKGPAEALALNLSATLPDYQARLQAEATADSVARSLTVSAFQADWRQQPIRLLAPVHLSFADGVAMDRLRLGFRQAVLEVAGRAGTTLDLTASLRNLPADVASLLAPAYAADGSVQAEARITGTAARPTGKVHVAATGLRMRSGPGRAVPPASVTADANLNGADAHLDVRVAAGRSNVALTGRAPLTATGAMDLRAKGMLDLALLDPMLAAGGRRVRGQVTVDAAISGAATKPNVSGTAQLAGGEVQDAATGLRLDDLTAQLQANGGSIRIVRLSAKAGPGTISASGTIGLQDPGLPLDLTLTAQGARPLSSDMISAVIDANLTLRGQVVGELTAGGSLHVQRAEVRIPERMPADIAVLPVRQPGAKPAPAPAAPSTIALNIALDAPRQVFVRGRGLEAEFGGAMKIGGTAAAPRTTGALELRRGSISLAGRTIDFTEGRIDFNGGSITDPAIHLVASSTSESVVATLTIGGTAHAPKITLSSSPSLPQDEVLAHLLFGSGVGRLGVLEVAQIASSLATLTGSGGGIGDPLDKVRQGLGLDRLGVRSGANGSPTLEAGRYIAPRVYLGARQSASGGTQATIQYDITKGLKLEGTAGAGATSATGAAGASNGTGVGLTYRFEY